MLLLAIARLMWILFGGAFLYALGHKRRNAAAMAHMISIRSFQYWARIFSRQDWWGTWAGMPGAKNF